IARDQLAQRSTYARMRACELDHAVGEGAAPELAVEPAPHLRGAGQLAPEVCTPLRLVRGHVAREVAFGEEFRRAQRVVNPLARHGVCEASRVAQQRPILAGRASRVERLGREAGDARRVTL